MATTRRRFIIATFILACAAVALLVTSLATNSWVEATLTEKEGAFSPSTLNYGLFTGHLEAQRAITVQVDLSMSCLMSENVCLMSCESSDDKKKLELQNLVFDAANFSCYFTDASNSNSSTIPDRKFINAGLWVSSVLFLAVALLTGVLAAVFAVVNTTTNPVEPIVGVFGLYVWNSVAAGCTLLVMILWGSQFATTLSDNVAYSETITGEYSSKGNANLGLSYWLLVIVLFLHIVNLSLLGVRRYLLAREPPTPTIKMEENPDGIIFLY